VLTTRLTTLLGITYPIISAPMAIAAGGVLASAVSSAGALGLIGGGYPDHDWIDQEFSVAGNVSVGCGFITWNLAKALRDDPDILDAVLARKPAALFLSFGDPAGFAGKIRDSGTPLICQVQTLRDAQHAADLGADVIVAQGAEAGGHGQSRATMTLVPEVADHLANHAPDVVLCAAGGIADGRGLAAALMLGADGVVMGSRLWASREALVHPNMHAAAIGATGDDTVRSSVMDIARKLDWPDRYTARVLQNAFTLKWQGNTEGLLAEAERQSNLWKQAWQEGDVKITNTFVGEATGLIDTIMPAGDMIHSVVQDAQRRLRTYC
jgi:nitronate monooxygenase